MFDWLRINDRTAFYILLIGNTMHDIAPFMLLLIVALLMFAMPQRVLKSISLIDQDPWDEESDRIWGSETVNQMLDSYQVMLDGDDPAFYHD